MDSASLLHRLASAPPHCPDPSRNLERTWQPTDPSRSHLATHSSHLATHRAHLATHRSLQISPLHTCGPCATPLVAALPRCQLRWACRPLRAGRCTRCAQYARRQPLRRSWCGCLSKRCPSRLPGMLPTPFLLNACMLALPALPPLLPAQGARFRHCSASAQHRHELPGPGTPMELRGWCFICWLC